MEEFGKRLKELRKTSDVTQTALAEKLNIHPQTVSKWERELSEPDIAQLGELCAVLGVTLERLLGCDETGAVGVGAFQPQAFGKLLCELRVKRGESQAELAEAVSSSSDAVSRWERGITCPDLARLVALAAHFGIPVSKLYCGDSLRQEESAAPVRRRRSVFAWIASAAAVILIAALLTVGLWSERTPTVCTVTVDGEQVTVAEDDWFMPRTPSREGYDFAGWQDENGNEVIFPVKIERDCAFTATFVPHTYTLDYWLNGGYFARSPQSSITVESGSFELPLPEKTGAVFEGWYLTPDCSGEPVTEIVCGGEDLALYARWSDGVYTIRYDLGGGILSGEENPVYVTGNEQYVLREPVRTGYVFLGWYDQPGGGERYESVGGDGAKNLMLYALWQESSDLFTIYYDLDGGQAEGENPVSVGAGEVFKLYGAVRTGYDFLGWNTQKDGSGEYVEYLYGVEESLHLYAVYKPGEYLVRYVYDGCYEGETSNPNVIVYGDRVTLLPVYLYGHTFLGWYDAEEGGRKIETIDESNLLTISTLYARFAPLQFAITLGGDGGVFTTPDGEKTAYTFFVTYGETFDLPDCTRDGFRFLGWQNAEGETVERIDPPNIRDMQLSALWMRTGAEYHIEYVSDGGWTEQENPSVGISDVCQTLYEPVRDGYVFLGWFDNAEGIGEPYLCTPFGRTEDLTLYALWQEIRISGSVDNFDYEKTSTGVTITGYHGPVGANVDVFIPAVVDGVPVTQIGSDQLYRYGSSQLPCSIFGASDTVTLRSVTIPEGVRILKAGAFTSIGILQPVQLPSTVQRIEERCFQDLDVEVLFAEDGDLTYIGPYAFCGVPFYGGLVILDGVRVIDKNAFEGVQTTGVIISDTVEMIFENAFYDPNGYIQAIYVPSSVGYIGSGAIRDGYTSLPMEEALKLSSSWAGYGIRRSTVRLVDGDQERSLTGEAFSLPTPQKEGYTFIGWQDPDGQFAGDCYIPDRNVTLTAVWEQKTEGDGRTIGSAAVLQPGSENTFYCLNGQSFYFRPAVDTSCRIVITVRVDAYSVKLCRVRNNVTEFAGQNGDTTEYMAGDIYFADVSLVPRGTTMSIKIMCIPY